MILDDHGAEVLVQNIVRQAAWDWRNAKRSLARRPDNVFAQGVVLDCEQFFLSEYFNYLTGLSGKTILAKLEEKLEAEERLKAKRKKKGKKHDG